MTSRSGVPRRTSSPAVPVTVQTAAVTALAVLFDRSGSAVVDDTAAVLVSSAGSSGTTVMRATAVSPASTSPSWQVTVPPDSLQPALAKANVAAAGRESVTTTPAAVSGPALDTSRV
jgi:hypothetical protein